MSKKRHIKGYECPFCYCQIRFNRIDDLKDHLYKEHIQECLILIADRCEIK